MANFKLVKSDDINSVPIAVSSKRAGENISTLYKNRGLAGKPLQTSPSKSVTAVSPSVIGSELIDVVEDYDWKISPNSNIVEHPYILLNEYRINKSPMAAQLVYNVRAGIESTGEIITNVANLQSLLADIVGNLPSQAAQLLSDAVGNTFSSDNELGPYGGLYITKPTDFKYKLPYFTREMARKSMYWSEGFSGQSPLFSDLIKGGTEFVAAHSAGIPALGSYAEPGIYIERSKFFQPTAGDDDIRFSFPLLNTVNQESIQKNFNLIWLLCFQNSCIRASKTSITPPCIYRALIPGVKYMIFCYMSNISIQYLGTRRRVEIIHPATGSSLDTIIPEAYNITINISNLTTDSGNLMLSSLTNNL